MRLRSGGARHTRAMPPAAAQAQDPCLRTGHFRYGSGQLDAKQACLLRQLAVFYDRDKIETVLIPIITQSDHLSLRVLDWL